MKKVLIQREKSEDFGTFGKISVDGQAFCMTLELPWRDNKNSISSIPEGVYVCGRTNSPKFGNVFTVKNVPNRSHVLIHAGNHGGDIFKGMKTDIEGCILLGMSRGVLANQQAILNSKVAVKRFQELMGDDDFELTIKDNPGF